jgi:hypothetical protein
VEAESLRMAVDVPSIKNGTWYTSFQERIVLLRIWRIWVAVYVLLLHSSTRRCVRRIKRSRCPTWPPRLGTAPAATTLVFLAAQNKTKPAKWRSGKSQRHPRARVHNATIFLRLPRHSLHPRSFCSSVPTTTGRGEIISPAVEANQSHPAPGNPPGTLMPVIIPPC